MNIGINRSLNIIALVILSLSIVMFLNRQNYCSDQAIIINRLYNWGLSSLVIAGFLLSISFYKNIDKYVAYLTTMSISYLICFFCLDKAYKLISGRQFVYYYRDLEDKIADISNAKLYYILASHLPELQQFFAWTLIVLSALVVLRNTRWIAAIGLSFVWAFNFILNINLSSCNKYFSLILLLMSSIIVVQKWKWFYDVFISNKSILAISYPFPKNQKTYQATIILKILAFTGFLVFIHFHYQKQNYIYTSSPIGGIWKIQDYTADTIENIEIKSFFEANALFFEKGNSAYIKHNDSLSMFKYLFDSAHHQFDMYDFHQFRKLDIKGKYEMIDSNTLVFKGKNNKIDITIRLKRENNQ